MIKKILSTIFLSTALLIAIAKPVQAGTDLVVNCPSTGSCSIAPPSTPLYDEAGWVPGSSVIQYVAVTNSAGVDGFTAFEVTNYDELLSLGGVIDIDIYRCTGVASDPATSCSLLYGGFNLHGFRDKGYFTIDSINNGQTYYYYFSAYMQETAGNEYQSSSVIFDLNAGLELEPIPPEINDGETGSVAGTSAPGPASPPVCHDEAPSSAPVLTLVSIGTNTVSLTWTPVSPVSHYAIVFTRDSDGEQYGSTNIGNTTSYTVTNLSGGDSYTFEVFGVNGCAPGPRSNSIGTGRVPGAFIAGRPLGPGGEVLGVDTEEEGELSPTPEPTEKVAEETGTVLGDITEACAPGKLYIPWILLIAQLLIILGSEYKFRKDEGKTKHYIAAGVTLLSIGLFYWLRECQCYGQGSWLVWLCKWYWIVSIVLTALLKVFSYAFIEEISEKKK